jgi:hypothetical protein
MEAAKGAWEVQAGLIPGKPDPQWTKRWDYTSSEYDEDGSHAHKPEYQPIYMQRLALAVGYATQIMNPRLVNWVRVDFIWF